MPKMKTHRGAAKRFKMSGTGLVIKNKAGRRHILESKTQKRKRNMRKAAPMAAADQKTIHRMMPYK